jgi:RND family efflux transporter MFP subunit
MKISYRWISVAIVVIALGIAGRLLFNAKTTVAERTNTSRPASLSVTVPVTASWPQTIAAQGAVAAWQEATIGVEISGLRITNVLADVGSMVHRGQEIATLNQDSVLADLHKQEAAIAQETARLSEAKSNANRARTVRSSGALSEQQIQQYLIAEETAQANLAAAQAALERARIDLVRTHILAPDDGVISSRTAAVGSIMSSGTELFRMVRQSRLEWRAEVIAAQLVGIKVGQKAIILLPQGTEITGTVRMVAPTINTNTRTALIYVDLPQSSAVKAGMYAEGHIELGQQQALTVPQSAVVLRDGTSYVFEIDANNSVVQRQVKTGRRADDLVEIISGIKTDARIASTGGAFLNQGDLVNVVNRTQP